MSEIIESRRVRWLLATVALATVVLTGSAQATTADVVPPPTRAVNIAIGASTSASTAAANSPASNAVDGSASTAWCATQWTGSDLTGDLALARTVRAALFDFQGRALPSIGLFENPALVCQRYDRSDVPCVLPS
jgi:hypothetical protein